ncbi:MAG: TerB family tellurite resistance protein [Planctomycetes bacterium]|nr:TerB family tellurite resistance protein [Planctomycetota bacterium]
MDELSENGKRRIYSVLVRVANADGHIDVTERALLERVAGAYGIAPDEAQRLEREAPTAEWRIGNADVERRALARGMVQVAAADGVLDPRELELLKRIAAAVGLPAAALERAIATALAHAQPTAQGDPPKWGLDVCTEGEWIPLIDQGEFLERAVAVLREKDRWSQVEAVDRRREGRMSVAFALQVMAHPLLGEQPALVARYRSPHGEMISERSVAFLVHPFELIPQLVEEFGSAEMRGAILEKLGWLPLPRVEPHAHARLQAQRVAACRTGDRAALAATAKELYALAETTCGAQLLIDASELLLLAGEEQAAFSLILAGAESFPDKPLRIRSSSLGAIGRLGQEFVLQVVLWLGAECPGGRDPGRVYAVLSFLGESMSYPLVRGPSDVEPLADPDLLSSLVGQVFGAVSSALVWQAAVWQSYLAGRTVSAERLQDGLGRVRPYAELLLGSDDCAALGHEFVQPEGGKRRLTELLDRAREAVQHQVWPSET